MAVGDICTLRIVGRYQQQNIVNVMHYAITEQGSSELEVLENLLALWDTANQAAWVARHIDSYELIGTKAFGLTGAAKTPAFDPVGVSGAVVGTEEPAALCRTITLYTESAKHRRRGRIMLSGGAADMFSVVDGAVIGTEIVLLEVLGALLIQDLFGGGDTFQPCIPPAGVDPFEPIVDMKARVTPSLIKTRRVRQFSIG